MKSNATFSFLIQKGYLGERKWGNEGLTTFLGKKELKFFTLSILPNKQRIYPLKNGLVIKVAIFLTKLISCFITQKKK